MLESNRSQFFLLKHFNNCCCIIVVHINNKRDRKSDARMGSEGSTGEANTGGGGEGTSGLHFAGGSGIVIIRNAR